VAAGLLGAGIDFIKLHFGLKFSSIFIYLSVTGLPDFSLYNTLKREK
jgi:hypothetical protein